MSDSLIARLTLDDLRELLQRAGYRVEAATDPVAAIPYLRSATSGLGFDIRPGSRLAGEGEAQFADVAFVCVLQIVGELPADLINGWNVARRFARLQRGGSFVALCMDVSVVGGVTEAYLRAQIEIWDRLIQDLVVYLREGLREQAVATESPAPASVA
ncbi:YbjN domain-containing protein [Methylosinus sp. Sm6]|uniref:YbjN domain-containing protein n=1 Tax=Methylosinus sp. Sm6 TaxID=2866948 RepID=UPI001C99904D|nr:YbjN domain-containing protein [Methylosinus sp. Sm6]MBY6239908.1 YbjN domain-containing protein [Methylosinus sp. Sm6]